MHLCHLNKIVKDAGKNSKVTDKDEFCPASMKKGNKQCLFDTPCKVMVNKEMMSEYLDHKKLCMPYHSTIITPIKICIKSICTIIAQAKLYLLYTKL